MASRHSHAPTHKLIEYELWVSDSNMFHRDTALIGVSAMGGCVATAGRHSLLSLPRQLVNCNELQVPRSGTYIMKPTASCGAAQLWVRTNFPSYPIVPRRGTYGYSSGRKYWSIGNPHCMYIFFSSSLKLNLVWWAF